MNELRKDYLLDRWVVIAAQRKQRPTDFKKTKEVRRPSSLCPFSPGNENMTPPATLVYLKIDGKVVREKDQDGFRHKNWLVRCIPNLFPVFTPPVNSCSLKPSKAGHYEYMNALGHHEVLIESPTHDEHPGVARVSQLIHVINAYRDRFKALSSKSYVKFVSIFRNHGADAGASLSHAHTQIMAMPKVPKIVKEEMDNSREFLQNRGTCAFCDIIENERSGPRLIWENENFVVIAPWASIHPFEFWIMPKRHQPTIVDLVSEEIRSLALSFRVCFGALKRLLDDPPYNFGFHMVSDSHYHWHVEVYPRLSVWAGFEKSTGMFVNVVSPEKASNSLREAMRKEEEELTQ
jgi:UDPglucose--hexose-1-phosphate uridylyltransferase